MNQNPKISVCIPVFRSEATLEECLKSVAEQTFRDFEVVIADDASDGKDKNGRSAKKIVKEFSKALKKEKIHVEYIRHSSNMGLVETRRTLVGASRGDFVAMLDSDDALFADSLQSLFNVAQESGADIVHGKAEGFLTTEAQNEEVSTAEKNRLEKIQAKIELTSKDELLGSEIRKSWLIAESHHSFLWGKLIRKNLYEKALELVPFVHCTMAEDVVQYFFITTLAKKYVSLDKKIYRYRADSGITSNKKITGEDEVERIAQAADAFNAIFAQIADGEVTVTAEEKDFLSAMCRNHLANNIVQMQFVTEELKSRAKEILAEHWGEDFVRTAEKSMQQQS